MPLLNRSEVESLIPHRDPFLWIDQVDDYDARTLTARKCFESTLDLFRGHYPGQPVLPGVILCEMAMQAGALLIATQAQEVEMAGKVPVATRINNVKFRQMVRPGDTVVVRVELTERAGPAWFLAARLEVAGKTAAQLDFACALAPANPPAGNG